MSKTMKEHGVKTGITENDFKHTTYCRIPFKNRFEIIFENIKHA